MFDSNLDILNVHGPISMKIGMYCRETLFKHIPEYFSNLKVKLSRKYKNKSVGVIKVVRYSRGILMRHCWLNTELFSVDAMSEHVC